ncbi:MAG: tryptophan synthase subunit alpha [Gemmataceae bacterium]|nr:tryptophan synthase subunit alpha [Gemmataceae bacterium]
MLFSRLRMSRRAAFIPFLTAGDPDLQFTAAALPILGQAGADLIEVGFPFSDPIADGPVIQASYTRALQGQLRLNHIWEMLRSLTTTPQWQTPLVGMVSYSLIYRKGLQRFVVAARQAGIHGLIVPDLPVEEAEELAQVCRDYECKMILLVTPTTPLQRAERIVRICSGFVYVVSVVGITGSRDHLPPTLRPLLHRLRSLTDLPLCVGFGVSKPEHVEELAEVADGIIVGSALVQLLENARQDPAGTLAALGTFVRRLCQPLHQQSKPAP